MECKKCKKECLSSELKNGFCNECIEKYEISDNYNVSDYKISNPIANHIKAYIYIFITVTCIIGVCIAAAVYIYIEKSFILAFFIFIGIVGADYLFLLLLRSLAEIIQLLEDIKNK